MRSLSIAATGMLAQQLNVEVISNNIANMNTTAYKRQRAEFQDLLYQDQRRVGSTSSDAGTVVPAGIQLGLGVRTAAVYRIPSQGNLTLTDAPLDIALQGKGYFQVTLPSGDVAYTRAGSFQLSANGEIVTPDGYLLQPSISIPKTALGVTINVSGEVLVDTGTTTPTTAGQIQGAT
ncbi:MAG: flagellar hook-basal body complex protein, partial [Rhodospirillaceae bacterium]|nr:flagellar hook-basal body complex protein [Rhodospirillaceae bacterium]